MQLMDLAGSASAIGLYGYGRPHPGQELFKRFHSLVVDILKKYNIQPTYIGAEGKGYSGKFVKFGGRIHNKLLKTNFSGVTVLSISVNPVDSDDPGYDSFVSASLSFVDATQEILLCFVINEIFISLYSDDFDDTLKSLVDFYGWGFGYGFSEKISKQPEFHILSLDNGHLSPEEQNLLNVWYAVLPETRLKRLRDIYPYNILNQQQLAKEISDNFTFAEFIKKQTNSSLTQLNHDLHLWKIFDKQTVEVYKKQLQGKIILVDEEG